MEYLELSFSGIKGPSRDILAYRLSEAGYESFTETDDGLLAYIRLQSFSREETKRICRKMNIGFTERVLPDINWNETWEKNFEPVVVDGKCRIRAPFHEPSVDIPYEIIIEPKMSFGTGHHETTSLVISIMMGISMKGLKVLDMGCGTGVLAILAEMLGAGSVLAVDNEEWAYCNALENIKRNNTRNIIVKQGETDAVEGLFDIILANINRNVLIGQIPIYADKLKKGGLLIMSGFYEEDLSMITEKAVRSGFTFAGTRVLNRWVAVKFTRE